MMRKILVMLAFFLVLPFLFSSVFAQQKSERWVCLNADRAAVHSASVSVDPGSPLLPNSETYVFECLSDSNCTSGNATVDQEVFGKNNLAEMQNKYGYQFQGATLSSNPTMSDGAGNITAFTWKSATPESHSRRWLAMNYFEPVPEMGLGDEATQQQGTFAFETALNKSDCVSLSWDPYGRVFDSLTLDPVSGASVTLLKMREDGSFSMMTPNDLLGGNIINPQQTREDGGFSFVVPDGTYKLSVSHSGYIFPEQTVNIHSNYMRIYSDIYPDSTGEEIVQQGVIQHRDIPISPKSSPQSNQVKLMEYFYDLDKGTSTVYVKGRVSHPFARIKVYSLKPDPVLAENVRYRLLTETPIIADALGSFSLAIDQISFEPDETFGDITMEKVDLTNSVNLVNKVKNWLIGLFGRQVNAQATLASNFRFDPIPNYLEGYAYDAANNTIPNATVSVLMKFSNKPAYQTTADETGYFRVPSEFLPSMPYRIRYTSPESGQMTETSTSRFIVQNQPVLENGEINVNQFQDLKGEVVSPVQREPLAQVEEKVNPIEALVKNNLLSFILTVIVVLVLVAIAAVVYSRKKSF